MRHEPRRHMGQLSRVRRHSFDLSVVATFFFVSPACHVGQSEDRAIRNVLDAQVIAWNAGDIDGFMQGYWNSDQLEFRSPARTNKGWQATRDAYKAKYDTREKMGTLEFRFLKVSFCGDHEAVVTGEYVLSRNSSGQDSGSFELLFRRIDGGWLIVRDETK